MSRFLRPALVGVRGSCIGILGARKFMILSVLEVLDEVESQDVLRDEVAML